MPRRVSRAGGWGVMAISLPLITVSSPQLSLVCAGAAVLALVSHLDDRRGLSARVRFLVHFLVASALIGFYAPPGGFLWLRILLVLGLVWLINLYNFMDGADGLAGGMSLFGFLAYAVAAVPSQLELAYASIIIAGAAAGFLLFNFHPARIFLGDVGSIPLGFLAGALGYWGWRTQAWSCWFPLMVFAPFITDASITLLWRLARGEKFWRAHREHYYQRMVQMGWGHAYTALSWYVVMLGGALLALSIQHANILTQLTLIGLWIILLLICGWQIDRQWTKFNYLKANH